MSLEREFDAAMLALYREAREEGYTASYFLQMVTERGGVTTAKHLINEPKPSEGFTRLWELDRLELTVESLVLEPQWRPLFSADERSRARRRLDEYRGT